MPRHDLWRTKSVEQSIAETDDPRTRLSKDLTARDLTVFGVAVVVGAGIFTLTARTAADVAGPSISIAFLLSAAACGLAALCYAEFASTVPVAGSAYTFSYATFGELVAWIIGWDLTLEFALASAVVAKGWSLYLGNLLGMTGPPSSHIAGIDIDWGAIVIVCAITAVLSCGVKISSRVSTVITAIKIGVVVLVIVVGAFYVKAENFTPFIPPPEHGGAAGPDVHQTLLSFFTGAGNSSYGWYGLLAAAGLVFFAFIGFDVVATTAEETKEPQKALPRGILGSLAICTVLYVAVTLVLTGMVKYTELKSGSPLVGTGSATLATAFQAHGITWAQIVISVGAIAGLTTVIMVMMLGQTRVLFAMARDGLITTRLARTNNGGTPVRLTKLVGGVVVILAAALPMGALEEMVNIGTLFAYVLVCAGVVVLRRTHPDLPRGFRVPLVPLVPVLAVLACAWLMINLSVQTWLRFFVWMAVGLIVYFVYGRRRSVLGSRLDQTSELLSPSSDDRDPDCDPVVG